MCIHRSRNIAKFLFFSSIIQHVLTIEYKRLFIMFIVTTSENNYNKQFGSVSQADILQKIKTN